MTDIPVEYTVDEGVPVPVSRGLPLTTLEIGQSILFDTSRRAYVQTRVSRIKAQTGKEFKVRKVSDKSCRVWRTK